MGDGTLTCVHGVLLMGVGEDRLSVIRKKVSILVWIFRAGRAIVGC